MYDNENLEVDDQTEEQLVSDLLETIQEVQTKRSLTSRELNNCVVSLLRLKESASINSSS